MPSIQEVSTILSNFAPDGANDQLEHNPIARANLKQLARGSSLSPREQHGKPYATSLPNVAVTLERQLYIPHPDDKLIDPSVARVNLAASREAPDGTPGWRDTHTNQTVLQQHCAYWDPDGDGIISPWDIYIGCRNWGWNPILSLIVVLVIAPAMSYPTAPKGQWLPDPFFRIYLDRIHKNKHGSDSNTYDAEGRFRPQQFEDFFAKYDVTGKGGVDINDLARAHRGQRVLMDPFGWTASILEWLALYLLIWPADGVMRKDDVRRSFDGSLFQWKADEYAEKKSGGKRA